MLGYHLSILRLQGLGEALSENSLSVIVNRLCVQRCESKRDLYFGVYISTWLRVSTWWGVRVTLLGKYDGFSVYG